MKMWRYPAMGIVVATAIGVYVFTRPAKAASLPFDGLPAPTAEQKAAGKDVAAAVNDFALELAHQIAKRRPAGKMLISPLSISTAHSMLLAGLVGESKKELASALGYDKLDETAIHGGMYSLNYAAQRAANGQFRTANAFMPLDKSPIKSAFRRILKDNYDAEFKQLPGPSAASVKQINDWVKAKTDGMIPDVLSELPDDGRFVLMNASAFRADWEKEFNPSDTQLADFTTDGGATVQAKTMHAHELRVRSSMAEGEPTCVELPYKGKAFGLVVWLPPSGQNVWKFLAHLDRRSWARQMAQLHDDEVEFSFPKFAFDDAFNLIPLMDSLGAKSMFKKPGALLGVSDAMPGTITYLDRHKTHIEVDEKGTRAAAVTAMAAADAASMPFRVDRAFVYAIVHKPTGLIVFLGVCGDPTKSR